MDVVQLVIKASLYLISLLGSNLWGYSLDNCILETNPVKLVVNISRAGCWLEKCSHLCRKNSFVIALYDIAHFRTRYFTHCLFSFEVCISASCAFWLPLNICVHAELPVCNVDMPKLNTTIIWTPMFEWFVVGVDLCAQSMLTILGLVLNMFWGVGDLYYTFNEHDNLQFSFQIKRLMYR